MPEEQEYFIVSVKWTERREPYITLWGPNDSGYRARLQTSGRYKHSDVIENLSYYNNGCDTLAVLSTTVEKIAEAVKPGWIDGDGTWVPNKKGSWDAILSSLISTPKHAAKPRYRGAPKHHDRQS